MFKSVKTTAIALGGASLAFANLVGATPALAQWVPSNEPVVIMDANKNINCDELKAAFAAEGYEMPRGSRYDFGPSGIIQISMNEVPSQGKGKFTRKVQTATELFIYEFELDTTVEGFIKVSDITPITDEVNMTGGGGWEGAIVRGSRGATIAFGISQPSGSIPLPAGTLTSVDVCQVPGPSGFTTFAAMRAAIASFNEAYFDSGVPLRTIDYLIGAPFEHFNDAEPPRPNMTGAWPVVMRFCDKKGQPAGAYNACTSLETATGIATTTGIISGPESFGSFDLSGVNISGG
jgi:hypothetical protein